MQSPEGREVSHGNETGWSLFGKFVAVLVFVPVAIAVRTLVLASMWGWFVTPAFGLSVPPLWVVYGLLLFAVLVCHRDSNVRDDPDKVKPFGLRLFESLVASGFIYAVACGVKAFGPMFG